MGRYLASKKEVFIFTDIIVKKLNSIEQAIVRLKPIPDKSEIEGIEYVICDLVFIHECIHAYQDQVENKKMIKGDTELEKDAIIRLKLYLITSIILMRR